jgi:hypothetical protein
MRWLEVHRHWLTKIGGGSAGPVTSGEAVAVRGRFPDNPGQEQIRQFAGMAPSSCEQVAATALLASADHLRVPSQGCPRLTSRVRRVRSLRE